MSNIKVDFVQEDGELKSINFRRMLLTKCQQEFEKDKKDEEKIQKYLNQAENVCQMGCLGFQQEP